MEKVGLFVDPLRDGWGTEGVLWEVAVQEGYALHSRVEPMPGLSQNAVYKVMDPDLAQSFLICLDNEIKPTTVDELGLSVDELFICRDVSLTDDLAANLALQCRLKTI
jgi:adenine-specific DNA-methyltransferase